MKINIIILSHVCFSSLLRVSWCVWCSKSFLFEYMCTRLPFISWSIAGVPSSHPGYLITAPPSVCIPDVIGTLAVWFQKAKKKQKTSWHTTRDIEDVSGSQQAQTATKRCMHDSLSDHSTLLEPWTEGSPPPKKATPCSIQHKLYALWPKCNSACRAAPADRDELFEYKQCFFSCSKNEYWFKNTRYHMVSSISTIN